MAHCFFWQMKCKVYSRGFLYDVFCKRTFLFLIISFHLLLVVELNSDLQINNCNRWVIWHTRNGLLTIMPLWPRFFPFPALSYRPTIVGGFVWREFMQWHNASNFKLYCALRSVVGCQCDAFYQSYYWRSWVWSCTAPCLCSELLMAASEMMVGCLNSMSSFSFQSVS